METDSKAVPKEYLLKVIENEINSGFGFVALARNAYRKANVGEGNAALYKAEELHHHAAGLTQQSQVARIRSVTHQLTELRSAIEWLMTSFESGS